MGNQSTKLERRLSRLQTDILPDVGVCPVVLPSNLPGIEEPELRKALHAYYQNKTEEFRLAVSAALQRQTGEARWHWVVLLGLVDLRNRILWSDEAQENPVWCNLQTEQIVAHIGHLARDHMIVRNVVGVDETLDKGLFDNRRARAEYLAGGFTELLNRVPIPPAPGVIVSDTEILGRILYHRIMSVLPPCDAPIYKTLEKHEPKAFKSLCEFLLAERRLDLLLLAAELREANDTSELRYLHKTMEAASRSCVSKYQQARSQLWCLKASKDSENRRSESAALPPIFDRTGDTVSSSYAQFLAATGVEDELDQLKRLRMSVRPYHRHEIMRDLCLREIKLWLQMDTRQHFHGLLSALHDLELSLAPSDCVPGLPTRHGEFLASLLQAFTVLGRWKSKWPQKLVALMYVEDMLREGKVPRFVGYRFATMLMEAWVHLWETECAKNATELLVSKQVFGSLVALKCVRAVVDGRVTPPLVGYYTPEAMVHWAERHVFYLTKLASYLPSAASAEPHLVQAQEVAREYLPVALAYGFKDCAFVLAFRGTRAAIRRGGPLEDKVFWPTIVEIGQYSNYWGRVGPEDTNPRNTLTEEHEASRRDQTFYRVDPERTVGMESNGQQLDIWFMSIQTAIRTVRKSPPRDPWWVNVVEDYL